MNNNYKQLKQILDNAPDNAFSFMEKGTKVRYYICIDEEGNYDKYYPDHDITQPFEGDISSVKIRRLSDIQEIVDLMEAHDNLLDKAKRMCELVRDIYEQ